MMNFVSKTRNFVSKNEEFCISSNDECLQTVVMSREGTQLGKLSAGDFFGELGALLPP